MTTVGITGHQRIPADALPYVLAELRALLSSIDDEVTGVTSLAAGADQLFAGLVLACGGELHAVIPARRYADSFTEPEELERYRDLVARASSVETLEYDEPCEEAYLAAGERVVDLSRRLVAVWDGEPARGKGGTADIVAYAARRDVPTTVIWPAGVTRD